MSEYTKGKWKYQIESGHKKTIWCGKVHIADVTPNWLITDSFDESQANAHLIASAPDNYGRNVHLIDLYESYLEHKDKQRYIDELEDFMPSVRNTIKPKQPLHRRS